MKKSELFEEIEQHLMNDTAPSEYLAALALTPALDEHPFQLLGRMQRTEQSPQHHPEGSVWNHTLLVVDQAAQRKQDSTNPRGFMWAALLHDIGKPSTTRIRKGRITSYDHDKKGAELTEEFLNALHQEQAFVVYVRNLVRYHMHILYILKGLPFADLSGMKQSVDVYDIALLGLCDRLGRHGADPKAEEENIRKFLKVVKSTQRKE